MRPRQPFAYQRGSGYFQGTPYQWGTGFPPYRNLQTGDGFGDFFRNVMRFLVPIVSPIVGRTARTFVSSAADQLREGKSFAEAAKKSIAPALGEAMDAATGTIMEKVKGQSGSGRKRRRKGKRKAPKAKRRRKQSGGRRKRRGVYKRGGKKRKSHKIRFLKSNF